MLYGGVVNLIFEMKNRGIKVSIITGEPGDTQFRKSCDIAFRIIQRRWGLPFEQMVYVGDNAEKDFQAPKQLGMRWMYFRNENGLYLNTLIEGIVGISNIAEFEI